MYALCTSLCLLVLPLPVRLAFFRMIPFDLGKRDLARLAHVAVCVRHELSENGNRGGGGDGAHGLCCLRAPTSGSGGDEVLGCGKCTGKRTSCLTMASSLSLRRTDSSTGRADGFFICPRQYANSCLSRALSSEKPAGEPSSTSMLNVIAEHRTYLSR